MMPMIAALERLSRIRREEIVVTTMGAAREWPKLSSHALDLHYIPSAMGQAPGLGLGLALARRERPVWVLNGDGCMWMNLGALVTIAAARPANYTLFVLNNGRYEVTGGQTTAGQAARADLVGVARASGIERAVVIDSLAALDQHLPPLLAAEGPRFVELRLEPIGAAYHLTAPSQPMRERLASFQQALAGG